MPFEITFYGHFASGFNYVYGHFGFGFIDVLWSLRYGFELCVTMVILVCVSIVFLW